MTQAINLANFSNSLDTSGGVPPSQLNAPVPLSKGGTNGTTAATARTNLGLAIGTDVAAQAYSVPAGGIIMWSGSVASIPSGWLLCNGTSGTPNLTDRFVIGAGSAYGVAATGGSADAIVVSHTHTATSTVTDPGHNHTYSVVQTSGGPSGGTVSYTSTATVNTGNRTTGITVGTTNASAGASGTNANLPPYYALAFIMKS
jgi:Phage Tail Collar Domain